MSLDAKDLVLAVPVMQGRIDSEIPLLKLAFSHISGGLALIANDDTFIEISAFLRGAGEAEVDIKYMPDSSRVPIHTGIGIDEWLKFLNQIKRGTFWISLKDGEQDVVLEFRVMSGQEIRMSLYFSLLFENFKKLNAQL